MNSLFRKSEFFLDLFKKTRKGEVRLLMGSTQKMGAGTNVQNKLIALHDLDCPWRPSDLEQRLGRIVRQGNENLEVDIYRYVTEETFDAYLYQLVEGKQKFASQIMTMLNFENNRKSYNSSILGLYGQNGSGKTALIDALSLLKLALCGQPIPVTFADYVNVDA